MVADDAWSRSRSAAGSVRLTMPDPDSCIYTGAHREQVETVPVDAKGKVLVAWYYGTCKGCGLVRRYSGPPPRSSHRGREQKASPPSMSRETCLAWPRRPADDGLDWETAFDAVLHTGGGRWTQFERIALQVEPTALFVDQFARSLESLGHIEIRRDSQPLEPLAWEVSPTALARYGRRLALLWLLA